MESDEPGESSDSSSQSSSSSSSEEDQPQDLSSNHHHVPVPPPLSTRDGSICHALPQISTRGGSNAHLATSKLSMRDVQPAGLVSYQVERLTNPDSAVSSDEEASDQTRESSMPVAVLTEPSDEEVVSTAGREASEVFRRDDSTPAVLYRDPMNSLVEMTRMGDQWRTDVLSGSLFHPMNERRGEDTDDWVQHHRDDDEREKTVERKNGNKKDERSRGKEARQQTLPLPVETPEGLMIDVRKMDECLTPLDANDSMAKAWINPDESHSRNELPSTTGSFNERLRIENKKKKPNRESEDDDLRSSMDQMTESPVVEKKSQPIKGMSAAGGTGEGEPFPLPLSKRFKATMCALPQITEPVMPVGRDVEGVKSSADVTVPSDTPMADGASSEPDPLTEPLSAPGSPQDPPGSAIPSAESGGAVSEKADPSSGSQSATMAPASPLVNQAPAVPSPTSAVRPKTGRAKTNAELKKQLLEKRATGQRMRPGGTGGDGASQASSPSPAGSNQGEDVAAISPLPGGVVKWAVDETGAQYGVGDMLWARVPGHPYWPSMVYPDPADLVYTRLAQRGHKSSVRQYHVQFFGNEGERGWVLEPSTLKFEGRAAFDKFCQRMIREHKKDKKNYQVAPQRRRAWDVAVASAEQAHALPLDDRTTRYMPAYLLLHAQPLPPRLPAKSAPAPTGGAKVPAASGTISGKGGKLPGERSGRGTGEYPTRDRLSRGRREESPASRERTPTQIRNRTSELAKDRPSLGTPESRKSTGSSSKSRFLTKSTPPLRSTKPSDHKRASPATSDEDRAGGGAGKKRRLSEGAGLASAAGSATAPDADVSRRVAPPGAGGNQSTLIQFAVFCQKRREAVKAENPTWGEGEVEAALKKEWGDLGEEMRSRYIPMGSDMSHVMKQAAAAANSTEDGAAHGLGSTQPKSAVAGRRSSTQKLSAKKSASSSSSSSSESDDSSEASSESSDEEKGKDRRPTNRGLARHSAPAKSKSQSSRAGASAIPPKKRIPRTARESGGTPSVPGGKARHSEGEGDKNRKKNAKNSQSGASVAPPPLTSAPPPPLYLPGPDGLGGEPVDMCDVCEHACLQPDVVYCDGPCRLGFHPACVGLDPARLDDDDAEFMCTECTAGSHRCFACKRVDSTTLRCTEPDCGRFYHPACLPPTRSLATAGARGSTARASLGQDDRLDTALRPGYCPLHVCRTCLLHGAASAEAADDEAMYQCVQCSDEAMYQCSRCPAAYHVSDLCLAAGSRNIAGTHIVCCRHGDDPSSAHRGAPGGAGGGQGVISATWCFACDRMGSLVQCATCPAAYHATCLPATGEKSSPAKPPPARSGEWRCKRCRDGVESLYGDIVWVKFGSYRWWPGEVWLSRYIPTNIQLLPHSEGDFPVCFFGSRDYLWTSRGRAIPFKEGDKCCREAQGKGLPKTFLRVGACAVRAAVSEAVDAYRVLRAARQVADPSLPRSEAPATTRTPPTASTPPKAAAGGSKRDVMPKGKKNKKVEGLVRVEKVKVLDGVGRGKSSIKKYVNSEGSVPGALLIVQKTDSGGRAVKLTTLESRPHTTPLALAPRNATPKKVRTGGALTVVEEEGGHESTCFRCGRGEEGDGVNGVEEVGGSLILCDKARCTKAYHLACLCVSKLPHGLWLCPWHHCQACDRQAMRQCARCPNSYCADHMAGRIHYTPTGDLLCSSHSLSPSDTHISPAPIPHSPAVSVVPLEQSIIAAPQPSVERDSPKLIANKQRAPSAGFSRPRDDSGSVSDSSASSGEGRLTIVVDESVPLETTGKGEGKRKGQESHRTPTGFLDGGMGAFGGDGGWRGVETHSPYISNAGFSPTSGGPSLPFESPSGGSLLLGGCGSPPRTGLVPQQPHRGKGRPRGSKDTVARRRKDSSDRKILTPPGDGGLIHTPPVPIMTTPTRGHRGRPVGSKNKKKALTDSDVSAAALAKAPQLGVGGFNAYAMGRADIMSYAPLSREQGGVPSHREYPEPPPEYMDIGGVPGRPNIDVAVLKNQVGRRSLEGEESFRGGYSGRELLDPDRLAGGNGREGVDARQGFDIRGSMSRHSLDGVGEGFQPRHRFEGSGVGGGMVDYEGLHSNRQSVGLDSSRQSLDGRNNYGSARDDGFNQSNFGARDDNFDQRGDNFGARGGVFGPARGGNFGARENFVGRGGGFGTRGDDFHARDEGFLRNDRFCARVDSFGASGVDFGARNDNFIARGGVEAGRHGFGMRHSLDGRDSLAGVRSASFGARDLAQGRDTSVLFARDPSTVIGHRQRPGSSDISGPREAEDLATRMGVHGVKGGIAAPPLYLGPAWRPLPLISGPPENIAPPPPPPPPVTHQDPESNAGEQQFEGHYRGGAMPPPRGQQQRGGGHYAGGAVGMRAPPLGGLDPPMFDNSDDEFPQLVIDVGEVGGGGEDRG